nr:transposase [Paenibacillus eucommiae]
MTGIDLVTSAELVAEIGDIHHFANRTNWLSSPE